jgi:pre-mRNA-splicing factor 18
MDLLAAEISRKRKEIATNEASSPNKKYIRQKDVAAKREKQYLEEQERLKAERQAKEEAKLEEVRKREDAARAREEKLRREKRDKVTSEQRAEKVLTNDEVIQRLRELGEPITFFGETLEMRKSRLDDLEEKLALERKRAARLAKQGDNPELENLENLKHDAEELKISLDDIKNNPKKLYDQMYCYFKVICQEWTKTMDERDPEVKDSREGIEALKIHQQCIEDFRPLLKSLKRKVCNSFLLIC